MRKEDVISGNAKVAEFMGSEIMYRDGSIPIIKTCESPVMWEEVEFVSKYHSSWDWLVPVILKCRSVSNNTDELAKYAEILQVFKYLDISPVWIRVVEFIDWYNTNVSNITPDKQ